MSSYRCARCDAPDIAGIYCPTCRATTASPSAPGYSPIELEEVLVALFLDPPRAWRRPEDAEETEDVALTASGGRAAPSVQSATPSNSYLRPKRQVSATCAYCRRPFTARRTSAKFCSRKCAKRHERAAA